MGAPEPGGWLRRVSEDARRYVAQLEAENAALRASVAELQREHERLGDEYAGVQEELNALAVLYAAADRMHATLDVDEIMRVVEDVVANLVGCEEVALLARRARAAGADLEVVRASSPGFDHARDPLRLQEVAASGRPWFAAAPGVRLPEPRATSAVLPLKVGPQVTGVLVLGRLLPQKGGALSSLDHQVLDLLALHAGPAFHCAGVLPAACGSAPR